jgi:hypothetical protein
MTPEEWAQLTPQQQAAHVSRYGPPPPPAFVTAAGYALATAALVAARRSNTWAIVALSVGIVAVLTLFLPMRLPGLALGAVAAIFGLIGAIRRGGTAIGVTGLLLGLFSVWVALAFG